MKEFPKNLTILLEPTADCNLRCKHCYHAKTNYSSEKMSLEIFEKLLKSIAEYYKDVNIIWHGGEPLMIGYDFYQKAYELLERYAAEYNIKFTFGIQTNGTLLSDDFIDLFLKNKTHISISYDGSYNSVLRQQTDRVEQIIDKLKDKGVHFSCISTISSVNVAHMEEMYKYFKTIGVSVKFNPIYPDGAATKEATYLITKEEWTENFSKLFELWFYDLDCNIALISCIDILKKYLRSYCGCNGGACLYRYVAVNGNGDIFPCGRLICDGFKLMNVSDITDIRETFISTKYAEISSDSIARMKKCSKCKWFMHCHSGCNAAANLNGDLKTPYEFDCYFTRHVFNKIEQILLNRGNKKINKYAEELISQSI